MTEADPDWILGSFLDYLELQITSGNIQPQGKPPCNNKVRIKEVEPELEREEKKPDNIFWSCISSHLGN